MKKIPMRMCVVTREWYPKMELLRIVKKSDGIVVDKTGESNACEAMSISSTSLSKDQFVSKLESYYGNSSASYTTLFILSLTLDKISTASVSSTGNFLPLLFKIVK